MKDISQAVDKPMVESASRDDRIREIAYQKYVARGNEGGDAATDWFEAEAEVGADEAEREPRGEHTPD